MKIWAKIINDDNKIIKDTVYSTDMQLTINNYDKILRGISELLDIGTPVSLSSHFKHLREFYTHRYIADDFVESVNFKALILEIFKDKD